MGLYAKTTKEFEMPDPGMYKAVCYRIIDLGTQPKEWQGVVDHKHKCIIMFELSETKMQDGQPFSISLWPTLSLHPKSQLRPFLKSWRGRDFTEQEAEAFDVLKLLDVPAYLNVVHTKVGDNLYANIAAIMPLKRTESPKRINPLVSFCLADFNQQVFDSLSEKIRDIIKMSPEYKNIMIGIENKEIDSYTEADTDDIPEEDIPF